MANKVIPIEIKNRIVSLHKDGLSYDKIAKITGVSINTVKRYVHLAKQSPEKARQVKRIIRLEMKKYEEKIFQVIKESTCVLND